MNSQEIIDAVKEAFDPIARDLGLSDSTVFTNNFSISLGYFGQPISLEIQVDKMDFFIYALVFRGGEGLIPKGYNNGSNQRQKAHLQEVIKELRLGTEDITRQLQGLGGDYKNCDEMASLLAGLVKTYWANIAARHQEVFR